VYQQQEGRGIGILNKIRAYALQMKAPIPWKPMNFLILAVDARDYGSAPRFSMIWPLSGTRRFQQSIQLPRAADARLKVVERSPIQVDSTKSAAKYLRRSEKRWATCSMSS